MFNALVTGDQQASAVFAQKLRPDGRPLGAPRALALEPEPVTHGPQTSLVVDPRGGYLLVYTSGPPGRKALYARRIASDGALAGSTTVLTGRGVGGFEFDVDRRTRRVLVAYTRGGGVDDDIRARLLNLVGRPAGDIVNLPYRLGAGGVHVAAGGSGSWLYGFARQGPGLESQAFVQSADSRGRPLRSARPLSPAAGVHSGPPLLTTTRGGGVLARWGETPVVCQAGNYGEDSCTFGDASRLHLRVIRP